MSRFRVIDEARPTVRKVSTVSESLNREDGEPHA